MVRRVTVLLLFALCLLIAQPSVIGQEQLPLPHSGRVAVDGELRRWHRVTLTFDGPETSEEAVPNPFTDYRLNVTFTNGGKTYIVPGYYAADGDAANTSATSGSKWRVHFTPDQTGVWTYAASFRTGENIAISLDANAGTPVEFDGESGTLQIEETNKTAPDFRYKGRLEYVNGHHLRFAGTGEYFLKHGANSPENFLAYEDFDATYDTGGVMPNFIHKYAPHAGDWNEGDPTWKNGKGKTIIGALNYLNSQQINTVFFLTYNIGQDPGWDVPGDGSDVWMWISPDEADRTRYDVSKLEQWEIVFQHMDKLGIQLHIITQEEENDESLGPNSGLNDVRKLYYRELVARYSHHLAVQWNLGEENDNSDAERIAFADYIRALDPYDHPITVHTGYNAVDGYYDGLVGHLEATSMQGDGVNYNEWTISWRQQSAQAGRKWAIYGDEQGPEVLKDMSNIDQVVQESLWGNLMGGGAGVEWYFGYQPGFGDLQTEDWRMADALWKRGSHAMTFFRSYLPFWEMTPDNGLVEGNALALAKPGEIYAVYLPSGGSTTLKINGGTYEVRWFNPKAGGGLKIGSVAQISGTGSKSLGQPPNNPSQDWAVLVRRVQDGEETPTPEPTAAPETELLKNGGFETAGADTRSAANWKSKSLVKSRRVCNQPDKVVAQSGECAFRMNADTKGKLSQKTAPFGSQGDTLTFQLWVKASGLDEPTEFIARIRYQDDSVEKLKISVNTGSFAYTALSKTLTLKGSVNNVMAIFKTVSGGKYWIDSVSLKYSD
jgi:hypothetical protein